MPNNYQFIDAYGSVLTARSSITSGSAQEPLVQVTSFLSAVPTTPSGNQSISGTVNVGNAPSIYGNISGSVVSFPSGTIITSLVSTIPSSVLVGASIFGQLPAGTAILGSVTTLQGTSPWNIAGSIVSYPSGTIVTSLVSTVPSSVLIGSSIFGQLPAGTAVLGSVTALQGTLPWNIAGSVVSQQLGTHISSVVNSIPSSLLTGSYGHRNDAVASYLGGNLTWNPKATDSAGRTLVRPFAAEESRIEGYTSTVNVSVTTLIAAAGAGLRNYITDLWFANTGSVATLITLRSGGGTSVLGYTIAPSGGGSNLPGLVTPIQTLANETFDFQATTGVSILYATVKGFKAP